MFYSIFLCVLLSLYCKKIGFCKIFFEKNHCLQVRFLANKSGCWQIHRKFLRILERDVLGLDGVREKDRG